MFKKLINHYIAVVKKYGFILPIAIVVALFGGFLALDVTNGFSKLVNASPAWFVVIAVLAVAAFVVGAIFVFKNLEKKELCISDLALTCATAVGVLCIVMFFFTSGWNPMSITKFLVFIAGTAVCAVLSVLRAKNAD